MTEEGLLALEGPQVPKFGGSVDGAGDDEVFVGQQRHGAHVTAVRDRRVHLYHPGRIHFDKTPMKRIE